MNVTADDIAQLLASPPPRAVPPHVQQAVQGGGCASWFLPAFGLVFGGFGMIFVVVFFPWEFVDEIRLAMNGRTTSGEIGVVAMSHMSINKQRVIEYDFTYTPADGRKRDGLCFTTGRVWTEGATVTVRYLPGNPDVACVEGARMSRGGWVGLVSLVFPLVGGSFVAWFVIDRRRTRWLLRDGQVAEIDVLSVTETLTTVNNQRVYRIDLANPVQAGGPPVTVRRSRKADIDLARKHAGDKQPIFILYDPRKPSRVIFPEALIEA